MTGKRRLVARFVLALMFVPSVALGGGAKGEAVPRCSECSGPVRILFPMGRILVVDAGMYAGLAGIWPDAFGPSRSSSRVFKDTWTKPPYANPNRSFFRLDDDPAWINGPLHALYGSEAYLGARDFGHSPLVAFFFAVGASFTWEYLVEGGFHRPSGIDLAWTPFAGAALGELRFQLLTLVSGRINAKIPRVILMSFLDPLGQLERLILGCGI